MRSLELHIDGIPQQQGSKKAFVAGGRAIMADANEKNLKPWRTSVADKGAAEMSRLGYEELLDGPLQVEVEFVFPRPAAHLRANGELKPNAPTRHDKKPDADKLQRAIGDALTGVVIRDDSRISDWIVRKRYGARAFARLIVTEIREATDDSAGTSSPGPGAHARGAADGARPEVG